MTASCSVTYSEVARVDAMAGGLIRQRQRRNLRKTRGGESGTLSGEKRLDWMLRYPVDAEEVGEPFGGCLPV
ncbi:MAG: hypothetical protein K6T63_05495 [Alicyclobacillus herbarius]|uniref:hypothetical protein n=1 Tax=Alicyclobacillus herbarius TaxID=122960 RepID=UPI000478877C|nr:hypothetical protein [Alicyclobacillus herbarius]MCL6632071.1 hypothetical protein [Alicyclobacillus herbarius]